MKKMTSEAATRYVEDGGNLCPYCESLDISGGERNTDGGVHTQNVTCNDCGKDWDDVYALALIYADGKTFPL